MQLPRNLPYYFAALGLFGVLKFGYTLADSGDLTFLSKPTSKFVGLLTGSPSVYVAESGYFHEKLNIVIEKSCSGYSFWLLSFLVFTYLGLKYFGRHLHKILVFPSALVVAYLLTIFANASRIFASVIVRNQTLNLFPDKQYLIHEIVGIITYLPFLILAYYLIEKFLKSKKV